MDRAAGRVCRQRVLGVHGDQLPAGFKLEFSAAFVSVQRDIAAIGGAYSADAECPDAVGQAKPVCRCLFFFGTDCRCDELGFGRSGAASSARIVMTSSFVDLHCHSTASDGTLSPTDLIALGQK